MNKAVFGAIGVILCTFFVVPARSSCEFPSLWRGKVFKLYSHWPKSYENFTFSENDPSTVVFKKRRSSSKFPSPIEMKCEKIIQNQIIMSWTLSNGKTMYSCWEFRISSPDVFSVLFRTGMGGYRIREVKDSKVLCVDGGYLYIGRANDSKDPVDFNNCLTADGCKELETCSKENVPADAIVAEEAMFKSADTIQW